MQITIRRILPAEAPVLSAMAMKTFYDTFTGTCSEADMQEFLFDFYREEQAFKELSNENDLFFFAEVDGIPAGYIRFMKDYSDLTVIKNHKALELKRLYILKEYHGKGIAQALMDFYLDYAIKNKFELVWLGVWEYNLRAQKFYEKYGFKNTGLTHDFPIGSTPQTDWWFVRFLPGSREGV